jgi:RNA polymerase sigma-70 factor (ECF subfamily)
VAAQTTIEEFYRDHSTAVYAFLVSLCRDRIWAEDLMQDTFVKATR